MTEAALSNYALGQVADQLRYLERNGAGERAYRTLLANVRYAQASIGATPQMGKARPEYGDQPPLRSHVFTRITYVWNDDETPPIVWFLVWPGQDVNVEKIVMSLHDALP